MKGPFGVSMKQAFEYFFVFFQILHTAGAKRRSIVFVGFCYLAITIFDLIGLGVVFFFVSNFLGIETTPSAGIGDFHFLNNSKLLLLAIPLIWLIKFIVVLIANRAIIRFSQEVASQLRQKILFSSLNEEYPKAEVTQMAAWVDTLTRQLSHAASGIIEPTMRAMFDFLLLVLVSAYLMWLAPIPFLVLATWLVVGILLIDLIIRKPIRRKGYIFTITSEELTNEFHGIATGFKEFWLLRAYGFFASRIKTKLDVIISNYVTFAVLGMAPRLFLEMLMVSGVVLILGFSELIGIEKEQILLSVSIVGIASIRLIPLISSINLGVNQLRSGYRTIENVIRFDATYGAPAQRNSVCLIKSLHVNGVSKGYNDTPILSRFSADFDAGKCTIVSGTSGCGKTTLLETIAGIIQPDSGELKVTLNDGSIHDLTSYDLKIGFVAQSPTLVSGSVFDNIVLGSVSLLDEKTSENLKKAIRLSGFDVVLKKLPKGLETILGKEGVNLSGGEVQRLALCRAIFGSDNVLILDEPTSALDSVAEKKFIENIDELKKERVLIIVSHSDRIINKADNHITFERKR